MLEQLSHTEMERHADRPASQNSCSLHHVNGIADHTIQSVFDVSYPYAGTCYIRWERLCTGLDSYHQDLTTGFLVYVGLDAHSAPRNILRTHTLF
jgi:hypothetical protein